MLSVRDAVRRRWSRGRLRCEESRKWRDVPCPRPTPCGVCLTNVSIHTLKDNVVVIDGDTCPSICINVWGGAVRWEVILFLQISHHSAFVSDTLYNALQRSTDANKRVARDSRTVCSTSLWGELWRVWVAYEITY